MFGGYKVEILSNMKSSIQDPRIGKVDVSDSESVEKWSRVLGISEYELMSSVEIYGNVIADIRRGRKNDQKF